MGGEGSIQAMRNILKNNKMLLRKKSYFRKDKSFTYRRKEYNRASGEIIDINKATKEDLQAIREKIIAQRKRAYWRATVLFLIVAPILAYGIYNYFAGDFSNGRVKQKREKLDKIAKFDYYLKDGDHYLELGQWHNSIFQYNKAKELFPSNYSVHYRLAYAFTYRCRNTKENCDLASEKVAQLLALYPDNGNLQELETVLLFLEK